MYLKCSTVKTTNQQKAFEDALIKLMKTKDYDKITVVEICDRAGITRRIFYRLFETKQDCLMAAIDHALVDSEIYKSKIGYSGFSQILEYIKENGDLFKVISRSNNMGLFMDRVLEYLNKENHRAKLLMGIGETDGNEALVFNISGFIGVILYWIDTNFDKSIDDMSLMLKAMMSRNI